MAYWRFINAVYRLEPCAIMKNYEFDRETHSRRLENLCLKKFHNFLGGIPTNEK